MMFLTACECLIFRGLYITIHDLGHVYDILCNWHIDEVKVGAYYYY